MRTTLILSGAALLVGAICFGADDEKVVPKRAEQARALRARTVRQADYGWIVAKDLQTLAVIHQLSRRSVDQHITCDDLIPG